MKLASLSLHFFSFAALWSHIFLIFSQNWILKVIFIRMAWKFVFAFLRYLLKLRVSGFLRILYIRMIIYYALRLMLCILIDIACMKGAFGLFLRLGLIAEPRDIWAKERSWMEAILFSGYNQGICRPLSVQDLAILTPPLGPKSCYPNPPRGQKMPKYLVLFAAPSAPKTCSNAPIFRP